MVTQFHQQTANKAIVRSYANYATLRFPRTAWSLYAIKFEKNMQYLIYIVGAILVLFVLLKIIRSDPRDIPGIPKPSYNKDLHYYSPEAVTEGRKAYEKEMALNKDNENRKALEEYASLVEELVKCTAMYLATSSLEDVNEVKRQAFYWAAWCQEYMKRTEDMADKYNFITEHPDGSV